MTRGFLLSLLFVLGSLRNMHCFAPSPLTRRGPLYTSELRATSRQEHEDAALSRRHVFTKIGTLLAVGLASSQAAVAAGDSAATVWLTGKSPKIPGEKPKDPKDTKGTRKDSNFLRSISDCKSQCERVGGPDGLARSTQDCLSECQDICCTTYEQCTFAIVPRI